MSFNIHELDNIDSYEDQSEEAIENYQDALLEKFYSSSEAEQWLAHNNEIGFWAAQLIYYGISYIGVSLPRMDVSDVQEIVTELFPRKITIKSPDDADNTIPELISFWRFLKREYNLPNTDPILNYLSRIEPNYRSIMNDPSKYGMAKSFMMSGRSAGFDMTNKGDIAKYTLLHNASIAAQREKSQPEVQGTRADKNSKNTKTRVSSFRPTN